MTSFPLGSLLEHADFPDAVFDTIITKYGCRYAKDLTSNRFLGSRVRNLCALHPDPTPVLEYAIRSGNRAALEVLLSDPSLPERLAHTAVLYWSFIEADQLRLCARPLSESWVSVLLTQLCQSALDVLHQHNSYAIGLYITPQAAAEKTVHVSAVDLANTQRRAACARQLTKNMTLSQVPSVWPEDVEVLAAIGYVLVNEMGDATSPDSAALWSAFLSLMDSGVETGFDELVAVARALCAD